MTPREAARKIGCNTSNVRYLIREGVLPAEQKETIGGFVYDISAKDVTAYAQKPQRGGYPRGVPNPKQKIVERG